MTDNEKPLLMCLRSLTTRNGRGRAITIPDCSNGVIAANYNRLEDDLRLLICIFLGGGHRKLLKADVYLLEQLNNAERAGLLEQFYKAKLNGTELADRLDWFVFGYRTCAENRNMLMHSIPHGSSECAPRSSGSRPEKRESHHEKIPSISFSFRWS
jgi:hypothetical protein